MGRRAAGTPTSAAVVLILGEDSYLAEQTLERVLQEAVGDERAEGVSVLFGDEVRWEAVLAAARTGSLFARRRAVVVRRADQLRAASEEDPVAAYLENPAPEATLVLLAAKPDRRRNPWKRLSAEASVHPVEPKRGRALRLHVEDELKRRGLRLTPDAVTELLDEVGQDLRRLMGEVDKLEAWGGGGREALTADDVHEVLGRGLGRPLYLLADAVAQRDLAGSLERLEELLEGGEEGLRLLASLHRSLRQVRGALALRRARVPRGEIGQRLLPPHMQFKLDALLAAAERWQEPDLRGALRALDEADRRLKRGADAATTLTATLVAACGGGRAATWPGR